MMDDNQVRNTGSCSQISYKDSSYNLEVHFLVLEFEYSSIKSMYPNDHPLFDKCDNAIINLGEAVKRTLQFFGVSNGKSGNRVLQPNLSKETLPWQPDTEEKCQSFHNTEESAGARGGVSYMQQSFDHGLDSVHDCGNLNRTRNTGELDVELRRLLISDDCNKEEGQGAIRKRPYHHNSPIELEALAPLQQHHQKPDASFGDSGFNRGNDFIGYSQAHEDPNLNIVRHSSDEEMAEGYNSQNSEDELGPMESPEDEHRNQEKELMAIGQLQYHHSYSKEFGATGQLQPAQRLYQESTCSICNFTAVPPLALLAGCAHVFCQLCLRDLYDKERRAFQQLSSFQCPDCSTRIMVGDWLINDTYIAHNSAEKDKLIRHFALLGRRKFDIMRCYRIEINLKEFVNRSSEFMAGRGTMVERFNILNTREWLTNYVSSFITYTGLLTDRDVWINKRPCHFVHTLRELIKNFDGVVKSHNVKLMDYYMIVMKLFYRVKKYDDFAAHFLHVPSDKNMSRKCNLMEARRDEIHTKLSELGFLKREVKKPFYDRDNMEQFFYSLERSKQSPTQLEL